MFCLCCLFLEMSCMTWMWNWLFAHLKRCEWKQRWKRKSDRSQFCIRCVHWPEFLCTDRCNELILYTVFQHIQFCPLTHHPISLRNNLISICLKNNFQPVTQWLRKICLCWAFCHVSHYRAIPVCTLLFQFSPLFTHKSKSLFFLLTQCCISRKCLLFYSPVWKSFCESYAPKSSTVCPRFNLSALSFAKNNITSPLSLSVPL